MGTFSAKAHEVRRGWYVVDATDCTLGRLASAIAFRLRGKHKPEFTPHVDTGDYIVVVNAARIRATGNKLKDKLYRHHTGYVGNMKTVTLGRMMAEHPERALMKAVKGMLPKNSLGATMLKKLRIFPGAEHEHQAQQPESLKL
ncbi:MAG: 50S ribosomal protein L13 [Gammaproteobacteria bacterium]|nr:50S ribosomal protein L13 [Gammaproteobacteria bacterium]